MTVNLQQLQDETNAMLDNWSVVPELDAARMKAKGTSLRNSETDSGAVSMFTNRSHEAVLPMIERLWERLPFYKSKEQP